MIRQQVNLPLRDNSLAKQSIIVQNVKQYFPQKLQHNAGAFCARNIPGYIMYPIRWKRQDFNKYYLGKWLKEWYKRSLILVLVF